MNKFIKLPLISGWTYEGRPCDSKPVLAKDGILVNLDLVKRVFQMSDHQTTLDDDAIPCSLLAIQIAWENESLPITAVAHLGKPLPYHPWWEGKFSHQLDGSKKVSED